MKDFAKAFYFSPEWRACRKAYMEQCHGLCEDCLARGLYRPAEIVHHIIELTPDNINDPSITLSFSNLRCVCRECHSLEHGFTKRRFEIDPMGNVISKF